MNSAQDKGPDGYLRGRNKWGFLAMWSRESLEAIINGTTQMLAMQNAQAKRSASFYLNSRDGKHKPKSPARKRAMFLGTCKFNLLGVHGRLVALTYIVRTTVDSDLQLATRLAIAAEITIAKAALKRALALVDEANAEFNALKTIEKLESSNQPKENEK